MIDIICIARQTSSRFPDKIFSKIGDQSIIEIILSKLENCDVNVIFAIPDNTSNDQLNHYLQGKGQSVFRGSENNVLERFIGASRMGNANFIQRLNCDNVMFSADYFKKCHKELKLVDAPIYTNVHCNRHSGQSVEVVCRKFCQITRPPSPYEEEHIFPYFYENFIQYHELPCPEHSLIPLDTPDDLEMIKESWNLHD